MVKEIRFYKFKRLVVWTKGKFGTGKGLLWYRICVPCPKRLPEVRDAFSETLGVKNRLFWYGRDIRYRKRPPMVRGASSARITKKGCRKTAPPQSIHPTIFPQHPIHLTAKRLTRQSNHNYLISIRRVAGTFSCSTRLGSVMSSTPFTISALTASRSMFSGRVKL